AAKIFPRSRSRPCPGGWSPRPSPSPSLSASPPEFTPRRARRVSIPSRPCGMNRRFRFVLFSLVVLLAWFVAPASSHAAGRAECRSLPSKILARDVAFCVLLPPSYDADKTRRYPVLYFLHGLGENEQVLVNSGGWNLIQDLWEQKQIGEFLIVTPAARRSFYINSRDGRVRYEDFFIREFLPYIESHYRVRAEKGSRGISGVSMGGYGALRFALRYPNLFVAVSAHSPALIEKLPNIKVSRDQAEAVAEVLGKAFGSK